MDYAPKLKQSFSGMWHNKSLWSVLILELILVTVVGILFFLGDLAVLAYINKDIVANGLTTAADWYALLNMKTYLVGGILLLIQGLIFVYLSSFFTAGFIGMVKNLVKDGSTTFAEFIPEAKRFWYPMFRLTLVRYAILTVVAIPAFFAFLSFSLTTPQFLETSQIVYLVVSFLVLAVVATLVYFWFLYSEACVAFEDMQALQSIKTSARMANQNIGTSAVIVLLAFVIFFGAGIISALLILPFDIAIELQPQPWLMFTRSVVNFLLNIFTILATIVASVFVFLAYQELTVIKSVRKMPVAAMPKTTIKRRR